MPPRHRAPTVPKGRRPSKKPKLREPLLEGKCKICTEELVKELIFLISSDERVDSESHPTLARLLYRYDPKGILEVLKDRMESTDEHDLTDCAMLAQDMKRVLPDADFSGVRLVLERKRDELKNGWARDAVSEALQEIGQ